MIDHEFEKQINAHTAKWIMVPEILIKGFTAVCRCPTLSTVMLALLKLPCPTQNFAAQRDFSSDGRKSRKEYRDLASLGSLHPNQPKHIGY